MSYKVSTGVLPRVQMTSFAGYCFHCALKDAGAARVTAVAPYLCYARKDRRTKPNDPVITRYVASLFAAVGTDAIVTLEVHNPAAFENASIAGPWHLQPRLCLLAMSGP